MTKIHLQPEQHWMAMLIFFTVPKNRSYPGMVSRWKALRPMKTWSFHSKFCRHRILLAVSQMLLYEKLPIREETNQILNFFPVPVASTLGGLSGVLYGNTTPHDPCSCCRSKCGVKSDWSVSMSIAILPYKIAGRVKQIKQWEVNICSFTEYTPSNT